MKSKRKIAKSILAVAFAAVVSVCFVTSFHGQVLAPRTVNAVAMDTEDEFMLGSWISYYNNKGGAADGTASDTYYGSMTYAEQTADLAQSGMNYNPLPWRSSWNATKGGDTLFDIDSLSDWQTVDNLYGTYNMKFAMHIESTDSATISSRAAIGMRLENASSYYVIDEPGYSGLSTWADVIDTLYTLDNTRYSFGNMLPSYAGTDTLGGTYENFLQTWVNEVGTDKLEYLGIDFYPLAGDSGINGVYFSDMETQRSIAYNSGKLKTGGFAQSGSFGSNRFPTANELKWNINTMLAYGYKMINHFCWVAPYDNSANGGEDFNDFIITQNGSKSALYEDAQQLNWQTRQLGEVMMDMDCAHAYHSGPTVYSGAERLPSDFMVQPSTASNDLIISEFISKDEMSTYVAITNNDYTNSVTQTFILNEGITGLVRYDVDSFDTLPSMDAVKAGTAVGEPTQVAVDVSSNTLTVTLAPGEMKLYKVEGSATSTAIQDPIPSLESGTYAGEQALTFTVADNNTQVYYTLDGSYPTRGKNLYTGAPIRIGSTQGAATERVVVRYAAYKGSQQTSVKTLDYQLLTTDDRLVNSELKGVNIALNRTPTFEGVWSTFNGTTGTPACVTDGILDPTTCMASSGSTGWAYIDFGSVYPINQINTSMWGNWVFEDVVIQLSTTADFSSGVYTVFNNDTDDSVGVGAGTDGTYQDKYDTTNSYQLTTFTFDTQYARYLRVTNKCTDNGVVRSVFTEIQAYTASTLGDQIADNTYWVAPSTVQTNTGWSIDTTARTITQSNVGQGWDNSYNFYGNAAYENFVIEADFTVTGYNDSSNGFIGFGLNKYDNNDTANNGHSEVYVGLFYNDGNARTFIWQNTGSGLTEMLGGGDSITSSTGTGIDFKQNPTFRLRVVHIDSLIIISVNGRIYNVVENTYFDRLGGRVGLDASGFAIKVSNLYLWNLGGASGFASDYFTVSSASSPVPDVDYFLDDTSVQDPESTYVATNVTNPTGFVVDKGTAFADIGLPSTLTVKDVEGTTYNVGIAWDESAYDADLEGAITIRGTLTTPVELVNYNLVYVTADVLVRYTYDREPYKVIIADAQAYVEEDYTVTSYAKLTSAINMSLELVNDEWRSASAVAVGTNLNIPNAINALVYVGDLKEVIAETATIDTAAYTYGVEAFDAAYAAANDALYDGTSAEVATVTEDLLVAKYALKDDLTVTFEIAGMSIRTKAPEGLRFVVQMSDEMWAKYANIQDEDVKFGVMILPAAWDTSKVWEVTYENGAYVTNMDEYTPCIIERGDWWSDSLITSQGLDEGNSAYSCALVASDGGAFPEEFYNVPFTAMAFVINGDEVVYSEKATRSITYVAKIESMKGTYTDNETVNTLAGGVAIDLSVGTDNNRVVYGGSEAIALTIGNTDATASALVSVSYTSSDESVAVIENGEVQALATGNVTITALISVTGGNSTTVTVDVECYADLTQYTPYYYASFDEWEGVGDAWDQVATAAGSTLALTSDPTEVISGSESMKIETTPEGSDAEWNMMLASNLGGIENGQRYLVEMKLKVTLPADAESGRVYFRLLRDGNALDALEIYVGSDGTWRLVQRTDDETSVSYDAETGVFTVSVFMTATDNNDTFYIMTVGYGDFTLIVDDVSFANA